MNQPSFLKAGFAAQPESNDLVEIDTKAGMSSIRWLNA